MVKKLIAYLLGLVLLLVVLVVTAFGLYTLMSSERYQAFGEITPRVETQDKVIALTFDDGPTEYVPEVLALLKEHEVKATFYVIGNEIEKNREMTQGIVNAGHELGNHSYSHHRMVLKSPQFIERELKQTDELIRKSGYTGEITFRPPYGKKLFLLPWYLRSHGKKTIMWDVEPRKYLGDTASTEEITQYVLTNTKPGSIILIHPWYGEENASREALPAIIQRLTQQGYRFVTIQELLSL